MNFLAFAQILQIKIAYIFAYFPVVTLAGYVQTWITHKLGDDTAKNWGFLSFDPAVHFDSSGFFILAFPWQLFGLNINIGFGKMIPINPEGVYGKYKRLKKYLIFFSGALSYLLTWLLYSLIGIVIVGTFMATTTLVHSSSIFASLVTMMQVISSLSLELFILFCAINMADLLLYKFDKNGTIRENFLYRMLFVMAIAAFILPIIKMLLILLLKNVVLG